MSENRTSAYRLHNELRREAMRVLDDVSFKRAPIQSRLLQFLVDHAINGEAAPTQYEIAVDGLGKSDDYDVENDSYPRVQISRLRRNLENYYARNLPGEGRRLQVDSRSYRIVLKQVQERAEPEIAAGALAAYPATAPAGSGAAPAFRHGALLALTAIAIIAVAALFVLDRADAEAESPAGLFKPSTSLVVQSQGDVLADADALDIMNTAELIAFAQMRNSFVSRHRAEPRDTQRTAYTLNLSFAPQAGGQSVFLSLTQIDGDVLYSNTIPVTGSDDNRFAEELKASLVYITSPTGAIAQAELLKQGPGALDTSGYACFLNIENRRASGSGTDDLLDRCLARYPDSDYRAFWHARRAFRAYQASIAAGDDIGKTGSGWEHLRDALEADRFNAFANAIAAKVEISLGNCEEAARYLDHSIERGNSYPVLVASGLTGYATCARGTAERQAVAQQIALLAEYNQDPQPLLQMYLVLGLLAAGDRAGAAELADKALVEDSVGPVGETLALLRRALEEPSRISADRDHLLQTVNLLVWEEQTSANIVDLLERGA